MTANVICKKETYFVSPCDDENILDVEVGDTIQISIRGKSCYVYDPESNEWWGEYDLYSMEEFFCSAEDYAKLWSPAQDITIHFKNGEYLKLGDGQVMMEE